MRATESRTQPHGPNMGLLVCSKDYDQENPQWDGVEAVEERIAPEITNPEGDIEYVNSVYREDTLTLEISEILMLTDETDLLRASSVGSSADRVTADDL